MTPSSRINTFIRMDRGGRNMRIRFGSAMLIAIAIFTLVGCTRVVTYGDLTLSVPAPAVAKEPYKPAISLVSIIGTSTNKGNTPADSFGPVATASNVNESVTYNHAVTGSESESCGNGWQQSRASSYSLFKPQSVPELASFGFTAHAGSSTTGGFREERRVSTFWLKCGWGVNTTASAKAETTGIINFNFTPKLNEKDHLIVRGVADNGSSLKLTAAGTAPKQISLNTYDNDTVIAELVEAGPYMLTGNVKASSITAGKSTTSASQKMTINIQSLKDSLALGSSVPGTNKGKWIIPVFMSKQDIIDTLNQEVFKDDGKYYPCRGDEGKDCKNYQDVYVEWPKLEFLGGAVTLEMHMSGHVSWNIFYPGITGDLLFFAVPQVTPKAVILNKLQMETKSDNLLVQYTSNKFKENIQKTLDEHKSISLEKKLGEGVKATEKFFPAKYGNVCVTIKLTDLSLSSWEITSAPDEGIMVTFLAELEPKGPSACKNTGLLTNVSTIMPIPKPSMRKTLDNIAEQLENAMKKESKQNGMLIVPIEATAAAPAVDVKPADLQSIINDWVNDLHQSAIKEK